MKVKPNLPGNFIHLAILSIISHKTLELCCAKFHQILICTNFISSDSFSTISGGDCRFTRLFIFSATEFQSLLGTFGRILDLKKYIIFRISEDNFFCFQICFCLHYEKQWNEFKNFGHSFQIFINFERNLRFSWQVEFRWIRRL